MSHFVVCNTYSMVLQVNIMFVSENSDENDSMRILAAERTECLNNVGCVCQFEKGVLKDLEISGTGLVVHETIRMLGQVCFARP